jgi:hypothetical protein
MAEPSFLRDTRSAYDSVAAAYAERFQGELAGKPLDRALFAAFAELVQGMGGGAVADIGRPVCVDAYRLPPGHVAGLLTQAGLQLRAQLLREPHEDVETDQRAYLLARKPAATGS